MPRATTVNLDALGRLGTKLRAVADLSNIEAVRPLLEEFGRIIVEDNRRGVLAGLDRHGRRVAPVTYRGSTVGPVKTRGRNFGRASGTYKGGSGANLSPSEYKKLNGPPLAPRYQQSRIIANLVVTYGAVNMGRTIWQTTGYWKDVVRPDGRPLLPPHFRGARLRRGRLPKRDMAGVRPQGRREARQKTREWAREYLRILKGR